MKRGIQYLTRKLSIPVLFVAFIAAGCSDVAGPNDASGIQSENYDNGSDIGRFTDPLDDTSDECENSGSYTLKASKKSIDSGTVSYEVTGDNIIVTFTAKSGWGISETHLYVSDSLDNLETAGNGSPKQGHMPYSSNHHPAETVVVFTIPLSDAGLQAGDSLYIVAHAVVGELNGGSLKKTETAYAGDNEGDGPRWWWYIQSEYNNSCSGWGKTE